MDEQNDSNELEIKEGDLLEVANNILSLLDYSKKIEDEESLFSDDFYVSIIGNLLSDIQPEISPGESKEEKAEIMNKLIKTLSQAIEVDLKHINGAAIVLNHDKVSAKYLLDLISELIKTIIDNNLEEGEAEAEQEGEGEEENISEKNNFEINSDTGNKAKIISSEKKHRNNMNLSESNELNKNIEIYNDEDVEIENENSNKKSDIAEEINYGEADSIKSSDKKHKNKSEEKKDINENEVENDYQNNIILTNNSTKSNKRNSKTDEKENQDNLSSSKNSNKYKESSNKKIKEESSNKKNKIINDENINNSQEIPNNSEGSSILNINRSCFEQLDFQKMMDKLKDIENKVDNSYMRQTYSQNDISRYERNLAERNQENEEEEENDNQNQDNKDNENNIPLDLQNPTDMNDNQLNMDNIIYKEEDEQNASGDTPIMNVSHITDVDKDKEIENDKIEASNKKNSEKKNNNEKEKISSTKKKSNENPDLNNFDKKNTSSSKKRSSKKENDKSKELDDEEYEEEIENLKLKDRLMESDVDINYSENKSAYSMPPANKKLNLPSSSEENEKIQKKSKLDDGKDDDDFNNQEIKKSDSILTDSHIINGSQMNKSNRFNIEEEQEINDNFNNFTDSKKESNINSTQKKNKNKTDSTYKKNKISETNSKINSTSNNKKVLHSSENKKNNQISSQKKKDKSSSKKNIDQNIQSSDKEKQNENINSNEKEENNNIENNENQNNKDQNLDNENQNKNTQETLPVYDDTFKYEIMKEFRRIYGDKLDYLFLKYNSQLSPNSIELALRNIKLAKEKMVKLGSRIPEPDDSKTKEYLQKYEKELEMMLINYNKEQKKGYYFRERAIKNFNQNLKDTKKIKEIEKRKTDNEIERRRKAKEIRSYHNKMKFSNNIYKKALALEKEKNLEEVRYQKELIKKENEEKRKAMMTIEKYYKDQIKMLKEILQKEKKERDMEHRAHMLYLNQLEREQKEEYKKQLTEIFNRFDEEERIAEFEENNRGDIKRIFESYYGH